MTRLFVYGTLKRGYCRHHALADGTYLGEARTRPLYRMLKVQDYPGLLEVPAYGLSILGEVWEVSPDAIIRLDEVEGTDLGLFERRSIWLNSPFDDVPVEAYFYLPDATGCPDCGDSWDDLASRVG